MRGLFSRRLPRRVEIQEQQVSTAKKNQLTRRAFLGVLGMLSGVAAGLPVEISLSKERGVERMIWEIFTNGERRVTSEVMLELMRSYAHIHMIGEYEKPARWFSPIGGDAITLSVGSRDAAKYGSDAIMYKNAAFRNTNDQYVVSDLADWEQLERVMLMPPPDGTLSLSTTDKISVQRALVIEDGILDGKGLGRLIPVMAPSLGGSPVTSCNFLFSLTAEKVEGDSKEVEQWRLSPSLELHFLQTEDAQSSIFTAQRASDGSTQMDGGLKFHDKKSAENLTSLLQVCGFTPEMITWFFDLATVQLKWRPPAEGAV